MAASKTKSTIARSKSFALFCARIMEDKKAENILVMDLSTSDGAPAEFFVIGSCLSEVQVDSVSSAIERGGKEAGEGFPKSEGWNARQWVILDYFDVVVHVFHKEARDFYRIEKLWSDADFYVLKEEKLSKMTKSAKQEFLNELSKERRLPERFNQHSSFEEDVI
ncbi:MAG: ribosome silencing factor [Candidatus Kapaibacteriota bacterium]